ncbi:MAG: radical SAM protein [bacterium]
MAIQNVNGKKILLISGLGHTDLSGKVPRPGLLMLRNALRAAGHDATINNYATSLMPRMFPQAHVDKARIIFERTVKPLVVDGTKPGFRDLPRIIWDMRGLKKLSLQSRVIEQEMFRELAHEIAEEIRSGEYDAVGFSLYLGSSTSGSMVIADLLKEQFPDLPILFGGPQTMHFAETIYKMTQAPTALVQGEGEQAIVGIMNMIDNLKAGRLSDLSKIPNLVFRQTDGRLEVTAKKRLSLDEWVAMSGIAYEEGDFEGLARYAFIETSRGCKFGCEYCPQPLLSGKIRYLKPAPNIVDEMVDLNTRFGMTHFELVGSSTSPQQAEELADELIRRGLQDQFSWVLFMRGKDGATTKTPLPELMRKIQSAGASAIFFGVEAADNATLKLMSKGETSEEIRDAMIAAREAGIATIGSFIYPYPGMPANEADLIIEFLRETKPLSAPSQPLGLFPGTRITANAKERGIEPVYPRWQDRALQALGLKPKATMQSPEILEYFLTYPLIMSLPMRLWPSYPYKINGQSFPQYVKSGGNLQQRVAQELGILLGFSHSHHLFSQVMGIEPRELYERLFYSNVTGDPAATENDIRQFNANVPPTVSLD